jgi:diguanylate cyclase (GGDEF)-like protein
MNSMVKRVKGLFSEQIKQIEALRKEAYQDPLTGLANRQFFLQQLDALLQDEEEFIPGFVLIIGLDGLYELYKKGNKKEGDALTIAVAEICLSHWTTLVFRITGNNFAVIVQNQDLESYQKTCDEFLLELQQLEQEHREVRILLGSTSYQLHQPKGAVLGELDKALADARTKTTNIAYRGQESDFEKLVIDLLDLESALKEQKFILNAQPIVDNKNKLFHEEVLVRMQTEQNDEISAGYFMPYAEKLHKAHEIDLYVLAKAEETLVKSKKTLAFNLSTDTIMDPKNRDAYLEKLERLPLNIRKRIHVELSESLIIKHFSEAKSFIQALHKLHIKAGIDQFGLHFSSLYYLNELPIRYIKLHGSLIQDITNRQSKTFSPHYFYKITKSLGIEVIVTQVEKKDQWEALQGMSIRWGQGIYLGVSKKLK